MGDNLRGNSEAFMELTDDVSMTLHVFKNEESLGEGDEGVEEAGGVPPFERCEQEVPKMRNDVVTEQLTCRCSGRVGLGAPKML